MYRVGVDIGGTGVKVGIVTDEGKIILKKDCRTDVDSGFDKVMNDIKNLTINLLNEAHIEMTEIQSIGVGIPSFINKRGEVTCVNLNWYSENIVQKLNELFPNIPTFVENDATVAAIAESKFGSMKNHNIGIMLTLGTGVGGGIIINDRPFTGSHGMASELGHVIIGENEYNCNCGNNGCFETFCSATAIIEHAKRLLNGNTISLLNNVNVLTAKDVFDAYREEDAVAIQVINRFKKYLAIGIAGIINSLDPDIIAIGGGVSKSEDVILNGLKEQIKEHILYKEENFATITTANLGNDAGIIGAAYLG